MKYLTERAESLKKKEIEHIEKWIKLLEKAENNEFFNSPWFRLIKIGMFDYPDLIKY